MLNQPMLVMCAVIASFLFVITVSLPFLSGDSGKARLKAIRASREAFREEISSRRPKTVKLREKMNKRSFYSQLSARMNLSKYVNMDKLKTKLMRAGWRDPNTLPKFLVIRMLLPIGLASYVAFTLYTGGPIGKHVSHSMRPIAILGAIAVGFFMPGVLLSNAETKRAQILGKQFPDALDLLLVCVEAGLSVEQSFMRITEEIGESIPEVAEEFAITGAELSFLGDRGQAYTNMVTRTQMPEFKGLATALAQSEAYGSSVGGALRVLSEDSREMRKSNVEKKAASLSPKMTIPMIMLILPCMFLVLMGPAVLKVLETIKH
jgi:tight adherence protein C